MQIKNNKYFKDGCNLENFSKLKKMFKTNSQNINVKDLF